MMKVKIADSNADVGREFPFSFTSSAQELDMVQAEYSIDGPIEVQGTIVNTGHQYRLQGKIKCLKSFVCDRCLGHFTEKQHHRFSEDFRLGEDGEEEESTVNYFNGDAIDIADMVRDTILAAQPLNNIFSSDCRGLCPKCGADLNKGDCGCDRFIPDPRLAALQHLLKKK